MKRRRNVDWGGEWMGIAIAVLAIAVFVGGGVALRLWVVGGDWRCFFSQDPAICVAISEAGR